MKAILPALLAASLLTGCAAARGGSSAKLPGAPERKVPYAVLSTGRGEIIVRLLSEDAPKTVAGFTDLARRSLLNGTSFFRVIPGFIIQGGDPAGAGFGGAWRPFEEEIRPGGNFNRPGVLAVAGPGQFFVTLAAAPWLNGKNVVFGQVVQGLETAQAIGASERIVYDPSGRQIDQPKEPQIIRDVRIEERP